MPSSTQDDQGIAAGLVCPQCRERLHSGDDSLNCARCGAKFSIRRGIPDFRKQDEYWCNVSREKMRELNDEAKKTGDWYSAAKRILPRYLPHFSTFERADCQFLWPTNKDSVLLDAGSMWGGITIPAAQFHKEVYALDKTTETMELLNIRAKQMGINNIRTIASGLNSQLPFPDNFFDMVIISGVLEWVALDGKVTLEKQWHKFGRGFVPEKRKGYLETPREMQLNVLKEVRRILKPGGSLYLAIENSVGYIYFLGYPDDHMNIPFLSFSPRWLSNLICKIFLGCEYRTYVYTIAQYRKLLKDAGFGPANFYGAFMHYIKPSDIVPLDLIAGMKSKLLENAGPHKHILKFIPNWLLQWVSPSVIMSAVKDDSKKAADPRLISLLKKAGVIPDSSSNFELIKRYSRPGNLLTANFWIYDKTENRPKFFCKVCRTKNSDTILDVESGNLKTIHALLKGTELEGSIPKLTFSGTIDGISLMVTEFRQSEPASFKSRSSLFWKGKNLDRDVRQSIDFLVSFQKLTKSTEVDAVDYLTAFLDQRKKILKEASGTIDDLIKDIQEFKGIKLSLCSQHGDFDFFYNIMFAKDGIRLFDFEHFQKEALPFLDLSTLIINPIILSLEAKMSGFSKTLTKPSSRKRIAGWLDYYAEVSGIPKKLVQLAPAIAAIEQKTMDYPESRDPNTFPINTAFEDVVKFKV